MVEKETLQEWLAKERETINTVARHFVPRYGEPFSVSFDLRDLYPEFKSRPIRDTSLYTYCHRELNVKMLLLFQDVVIINLEPYDEQTFKKVYGITIDEAIDLYKEGFIEVRLRSPYREYVGSYDVDKLLYAASSQYGGYVPHADRHWFIATTAETRERPNILHKLYFDALLGNPHIRRLLTHAVASIRAAFEQLWKRPSLDYELYSLYRGSSLATISRIHYIMIRDLLAWTYDTDIYSKLTEYLEKLPRSTSPSYVLDSAKKLRALALAAVWPWTASLGGLHIYPAQYFKDTLTFEQFQKLLREQVRLGFDKVFVSFAKHVLDLDPTKINVDELKSLKKGKARSQFRTIVNYLEAKIRDNLLKPLMLNEAKPRDLQHVYNELRELATQELPQVIKECVEAVATYVRHGEYRIFYSVGLSIATFAGTLMTGLVPWIPYVVLGLAAASAAVILPRKPFIHVVGYFKKCPILSSIVDILEVTKSKQDR